MTGWSAKYCRCGKRISQESSQCGRCRRLSQSPINMSTRIHKLWGGAKR